MRYDGQGYDVTVPLDRAWLVDGDTARVARAFHDAHRATYGHANEQAAIWLKELRAHITGAMPAAASRAARGAAAPGPRATTRPIRLLGRTLTATVIDRAALHPQDIVAGPAIINQMDTTTLVPPDWQARRIEAGALVLERRAADAGTGQ